MHLSLVNLILSVIFAHCGMNKLLALYFYFWLYFTITILFAIGYTYKRPKKNNCNGQLIKSLKKIGEGYSNQMVPVYKLVLSNEGIACKPY